ncbi:tetratricopeptide repeat protein [Phormidium sp. LEGE 05292]|uniref:tetratricopeptide repeat protein n=1 Tax=[Phormidium] sp. LEGE 05292 TaxID=767427 RepID=UPI00187E432D|nr:tetratricopeptide repeat protein [Phormidium sp. LEGE 05292]MBE9224304.1 tetratricopeptide repeat protein [Phormidium sp. LEGE 05292]
MDITKIAQQATEYFNQGEYDRAIALYEQCIQANPALRYNYWYLGLAWLLQGEESEAQAIWLSVMTETPEEMDNLIAELLEILTTKAKEFLDSRKLQLAEKIYGQIIEIDATQAAAYYNLGNALAQQGNFEQAIECWQQSIELQPDLVDAYKNQGNVLQKLENFPDAIANYLKVLELQPDYDTAYNLGLCFSQIGRFDDAIACFQTTIEINPDYTPAYSDLGNLFLQQNQLEQAIFFFSQAIQLNPNFAQSYCHWQDILSQQGKSNEIIHTNACLLKALYLPENGFKIYFYLGKLLTKTNNLPSAIALLQKAAELQKDSPEIYWQMGKAFAKMGDLETALANYQKAIKLEPIWDSIYLDLGISLAKKGDLLAAIKVYNQALEINPKNHETYFYLGCTLSNIGQLDEAIVNFYKTLELQPQCSQAYWNLGSILAQQNQPEKALACCQKVMKIKPDMAQSIYDLMINLSQQGWLDEKTQPFQQLLPVETPLNFYETTLNWAISQRLENTNYCPVYPQDAINLIPPQTLDENIHFSFRFGNKIQLPGSFVAIVPDGRYWLNQAQDKSAVITSDNQLLGDISPQFPVLSPGHPDNHPSKHSIFSLSKLPHLEKLNETVAILAGLLNDTYFHWMFDILPRIELLHRGNIEITKIEKFLVSSHLPFQKETLNLLGIPETKILETHKYPHIQATKLVVPSFPSTIAWMPKWVCDFLRTQFLQQPVIAKTEKIERLYISRKDTANRRIINEDEIIDLLKNFGFQSIVLESMPVVEQAALLTNAKVVIAPHGGGLTNIVFCHPGTKVIEIFSPNYVYPCYWLVSNLINLDYYYLLGENPEGFYIHKLLYPNARIEDIFVNPTELLNILHFAGLTS